MTGQPLISIVVPSYNQGRYLGETLQSLVAQNYSNLEVIIQDGGSTDGAITIATEFVDRFPHVFKLFVEKDSGQADALNRGFARASGEILGFLNSDDTLYPGCLASVAREIDPKQNRLIVMGRCLFTGENSVYVGVEHPSSFKSRFEQLAIWKRGYNTTPQPSVFWHRKVWTEDGGFDVAEHHALDYDLFCRFSRKHRFHEVDELWSTYRMHADSKSFQRSEAEILALSIKISRRYWGSRFGLLRWRCEFSYWTYQRHGHEKARHHARRCEEAAEAGKQVKAVVEFILTAWQSPGMARDRLLVPFAAAKRLRFLQRLLITPKGSFTGRYEADRWVGPLYRHDFVAPKDARGLVLVLQHAPHGRTRDALTVKFRLNGTLVSERRFNIPGQYFMEADLRGLQGRRCMIELQSDSFFIPRHIHNVPDDRQLSIQLMEIKIETSKNEFRDGGEPHQSIGPFHRQEFNVPETGRALVLVLQHSPQGKKHLAVETDVYIDQIKMASRLHTVAGRYILEVNVEKFKDRNCILELKCEHYFTAPGLRKPTENLRHPIKLISAQVSDARSDSRGCYEADSYIGPYYCQELTIPAQALSLIIVLQHTHQGTSYRSVDVALFINQEAVATVQCRESGQYQLHANLQKLQGELCVVELRSSSYFIPHAIHQVPDHRQLSIQLIATRIELP
jgi:glycosyltransferase involved in cell wall biosynthesis